MMQAMVAFYRPLGMAFFVLSACGSQEPKLDTEAMSFFVTSTGNGARGGDLGGLAGADAKCQSLAEAAGSTRTWQAYLCTSTSDARDRIGSGPWVNSFGDPIAADVASLHSDGVSNNKPQLIFTEAGDEVPALEHDILSGCESDGTVRAMGETCADWTSSESSDQAYVGHSDKPPPPFDDLISWNSAHASSCDEAGLIATRGSGRLYCFALP